MKRRTFFNWLIIFLGVVAITGFCLTPSFAEMADAQPKIESGDDFISEEPGPDLDISDGSFGENYQYTTLGVASFVPYESATTYEFSGNAQLYFTSASSRWFMTNIRLPSGVYLNGVRFYYYDNHAGDISCQVFRNTPGTTTGPMIGSGSSSGTPGYGSSFVSLGETIRNGDRSYALYIGASAASSSLRFHAVRLYWHRQVNDNLPNPFGDIGGLNSRWQEAIKAMAASGITKGCNDPGTLFCPYQNVTRGQMAVFFAEALGLHWNYPY